MKNRKLIIHKLKGLKDKAGTSCYGASLESIDGERVDNGAREWLIDWYGGGYSGYDIKVIDEVRT